MKTNENSQAEQENAGNPSRKAVRTAPSMPRTDPTGSSSDVSLAISGTPSTLMFASRAESPEEMYDTIDHELKHCVEHISTYYGIDPKSEEAAYLQGEISKNLFPAVSAAVCPICNNEKGEER